MFPDRVHDGGPERLLEALRSPEARERLRREVAPRGQSWQDIWLTYFRQPHNHVYEGCSVAEVAAPRNQHPVDALCDLLVQEDLRIS